MHTQYRPIIKLISAITLAVFIIIQVAPEKWGQSHISCREQACLFPTFSSHIRAQDNKIWRQLEIDVGRSRRYPI
jgi:hypothetical protein